MKAVPEVGKTYNCFDDGKVRESRRYTIEVVGVIPFEKMDKKNKKYWAREVDECPWLYSPETDFFVEAKKQDGTGEVFVRTLDGGWFSIGGFLNCGRLDIDGSLMEILKQYQNE